MPVPRLVERKHAVSSHGQAITTEPQPAGTARGHPSRIARVEHEVRIPPCAVAQMPLVCAPAPIREVSDTQWVPARKRFGDRPGGTPNSLDQGRGSVARFFPWAQPAISLPLIGQ